MGRTKQYTVCLTDSERKALHAFVSSGRKSARQITRARILLLADAGKTDREIIDLLGVSRPPVSSMRKESSIIFSICSQTTRAPAGRSRSTAGRKPTLL